MAETHPTSAPNEPGPLAACPFLKSAWDDTIRLGYPNPENACYRQRPARSVALLVQEHICLKGRVQDCPVYAQAEEGEHGHNGWVKKLFARGQEELNFPFAIQEAVDTPPCPPPACLSEFWPAAGERLEREESVQFLVRLVPRLVRQDAVLLAGEMSGQVLGLYLAGVHLLEHPAQSVNEYLDAAQRLRVPAADGPQAPLLAAIQMNFAMLDERGERDQVAWALLWAMSCFAEQAALSPAFLGWAAQLSAEQQLLVDAGLSRLYALGLLDRSERGPLIDPVLAQFARQAHPDYPDLLARIAQSLLQIPAGAEEEFAPFQGQQYTACLRELIARAETVSLPIAGALWERLGELLAKQEKLSEACTCYEQSLQHNENHYGSGLETARSASKLGMACMELGRLDAAKTSLERSVTIYEASAALDEVKPRLAADAWNLGQVLKKLNDQQGAKQYFQRALELDEAVYGPNHPGLLTGAYQLGRVLHRLGDLKGAMASFERAMAVENAADHPEYAALLTHHGLVLQDLGSLAEAKAFFEQALAVDEQILGASHPAIIRDFNNLGCLHRDLGELKTAEDYLTRAYQLCQTIYGPDHTKTGIYANNLGHILLDIGDYGAASVVFERVLAIDEHNAPNDSLSLGADRFYLGFACYRQGALQSAVNHFELASAIFKRALPAGDPKRERTAKYLEKARRKLRDQAGAI